MKLIVGLGNPGKKYEKTRHNVGFMVINTLASQISNEIQNPNFKLNKKLESLIFIYLQPTTYNQQLILAKPNTFMNSSGVAVSKIIRQYKVSISDIWVIHDDLDLQLGEYKIQKGVGPKLHYGISSIEEILGKKDFWRVRVGVDNRGFGNRISGETYVLQDFDETEIETRDRVIGEVVKELINDLINKVESST